MKNGHNVRALSTQHLPMPKFFGRFSNNGLTTFFGSTFLTANGAGATFLPEPGLFFGRGYN